MPLEVECHTVPHLKALTRGIEHRGGHGRANSFRWQKISLKSKYSFYFINRPNGGFIWLYLHLEHFFLILLSYLCVPSATGPFWWRVDGGAKPCRCSALDSQPPCCCSAKTAASSSIFFLCGRTDLKVTWNRPHTTGSLAAGIYYTHCTLVKKCPD